MTDPNVTYWLKAYRNALEALEAARTKAEIDFAAGALMKAKARLKALGYEPPAEPARPEARPS
jgi:hypothetical protein